MNNLGWSEGGDPGSVKRDRAGDIVARMATQHGGRTYRPFLHRACAA